jgi:hypothetical protein
MRNTNLSKRNEAIGARETHARLNAVSLYLPDELRERVETLVTSRSSLMS